MMDLFIKNDKLKGLREAHPLPEGEKSIKNDELCTKDDEFCTKDDEFRTKNDEFCTKKC